MNELDIQGLQLYYFQLVGRTLRVSRSLSDGSAGTPRPTCWTTLKFINANILSAFILLLTAGSSLAANLDTFPFYRELRLPAGAGPADVASITMDGLTYKAACADSPSTDNLQSRLRIFDRENTEVPFCFRLKTSAKSEFRENSFPAEVLAFKELPDNRAEIIVKRDDKQPLPAALRIHTPKKNFEKQVTVSGSMDRASWTSLVEAVPIFDYSRFIDVRNDRVNFATNDFTFFKIEVANITENKDSPLTEIIRKNRPDADAETTTINAFRKEPFRMERISFLERKETLLPSETETREEIIRELTVTPDPEQRRTVVTFETFHQPLTALTLEIKESNFSRPVSGAGAETTKGPWQDFASGRISRIDAGKVHQRQLTLSLNGERRYRHYRIIIDNQDNPPLTVTEIRAKENLYEILFFPKTASHYRLYYGGRGGSAPRYDTEAVLRAIPPSPSLAWVMGAEQVNPLFKSGSRAGLLNSKILLVTAVILMGSVLALAIYRAARSLEDYPDKDSSQ